MVIRAGFQCKVEMGFAALVVADIAELKGRNSFWTVLSEGVQCDLYEKRCPRRLIALFEIAFQN